MFDSFIKHQQQKKNSTITSDIKNSVRDAVVKENICTINTKLNTIKF